MEAYKQDFIDFALAEGALSFGDFTLKSGRKSPYFFNSGKFDGGRSITGLGYAYASSIMDNFSPDGFDTVFGPAYKGIPLATATTIVLSEAFDVDKGYVFDRKEPKSHGEATAEEMQANWLVGRKVKDRDRVILIDDVFTTGDTKYASLDLLDRAAKNVSYLGLIISLDRQEVGADGSDAIDVFEKKTGVPVHSIVTISEVSDYLRRTGGITLEDRTRLDAYLGEHGTEAAKERL